MSGTQLALIAGLIFGGAIIAAIWTRLPSRPDLADALSNLDARTTRSTLEHDEEETTTSTGTVERVGSWAIRRLPSSAWWRVPQSELKLLQIPPHTFFGKKVLFAVGGLLVPTLWTAPLILVGVGLPIAIPAIAGPLAAAAGWFLPDLQVREQARDARGTFSRSLIAYIDLVALARISGEGTRAAMESAASIGDSLPFVRIRQELQLSRWSGRTPWDALHTLADELGVPDLHDFASIMSRAGESGAQVYETLTARVASMRDAELNRELAAANATSEKMSVPLALLAAVFLGLLICPMLLRLFSTG